MNLIVETDIGHDPDDLFAICYLIAAGVNIRTILISPGDPDQIAIAKFICKQAGLNIPIGTSKKDRTKRSSGSIHHQLLNKYGLSLDDKADGLGGDILEDVIRDYPDSELFVIGPVSSIGYYLKKHPNKEFSRATMQGGFLPYSAYSPIVRNPDFEGKEWMPTFNLNGDRPSGTAFINANIKERRFVGKNVCHTIMFDKDKLSTFRHNESYAAYLGLPMHSAAGLFNEAAGMYFEKHDGKKFHDPTAAVCHLHPEIGTWFRGKTTKMESGWTTLPSAPPENTDYILADINRDKLWHHLTNFV